MSTQRNRTMSWAIPVVVVAVACVVAVVLVVSGGSSEEPPEPGSSQELALGEEVYDQSCATCHGPGARGGLAGPPLVHEVYEDLTDAQIRTAIAEGKPPTNWPQFEGGMAPVPGLSAGEVDAVIAYVRDVQRQEWGGDTP
ncbi:MAG TPA: cytochrome c [Acidimicrobiales bacterium]|nr:cytochrome c [Acidimicrobiales bacterium]